MNNRPRLAVVANAPAPYRVAQHMRIASELKSVELFSVFKHEFNNQKYTLDLPAEINPIVFGKGETMTGKNKPGRWLQQWKRGGEIIRWLEDYEIDAVVITGYNDPALLRIIRWCNKNKLPSYLFGDSNIHGDRATGLARAFKNIYVPWVVRQLTGITPCGTYGQQFYERYGAQPESIFFVPHEPDYDKIAAVGEDEVEAMRAEYGLKKDRRYINFTARLAKVKRADLLIDAFARIAEDNPDWDLLMVGGGELEGELKARVPDELKDRVVWAGFQDGMDRLAALYKSSDVYVLPSSYEPWAVTVLEACACDLVMISSDVVGAAAEVVRDGVNGHMFTSGSVDSLTEKLRDAVDPANTDRYKAASAGVLADWRKRGDPVDGTRRALEFAGVLPARAEATA